MGFAIERLAFRLACIYQSMQLWVVFFLSSSLLNSKIRPVFITCYLDWPHLILWSFVWCFFELLWRESIYY